jgi:hypothetical protein
MDDQDRFLVESLELISQTQGNAEFVYTYWRKNLNQINESLIQTLSDIAIPSIEAQQNESQKEVMAWTLTEFGRLIQNFPHGNQRINIELSIAAYRSSLEVYTRAAFPFEALKC